MRDSLPRLLVWLGAVVFFIGLSILALTYYQVLGNEIAYLLFRPNTHVSVTSKFAHPKATDIVPIDEEFGIVIPKIRANSKIIANVDPYNEKEYQWALTKGVAQAKGSSLPYETGSMFLFSHSSVNFYEAVKYNAIFYLLDKLEKGDTVYIFYKGKKYTYSVTGKKLVDPSSVAYLHEQKGHSLFLMTCWPPGTSFQRLLVFATPVDNN